MKKIIPILLFCTLLTGCTQSSGDMKKENIVISTNIIHEVEQKIIPIVGVWSGTIDDDILSTCREVKEEDDYTTLPILAPYICTDLALNIHSYTIPNLNIKGSMYARHPYYLTDITAPYYLSTGDNQKMIVISGSVLTFADTQTPITLEKQYFEDDTIETIKAKVWNIEIPGYALEGNEPMIDSENYYFDGIYDFYGVTYRQIGEEMGVGTIVSKIYIFSLDEKNYYYVYTVSGLDDGGTWFKTAMNQIQLFVN